MATTTNRGHIARALDFFDRTDVYFGLGQTTTPWPDELNPPKPDVSTSSLAEPLGYKKVESKYMVVQDPNGTIVYRDSKWKIVPRDQAVALGSKWVYLESFIRYDELPLQSYRSIAVVSRLVPNDDIPSNQATLIPSQVKDPGIVEVIDYRRVVNRQIDQKEQLSLILEF